MNDTIRQAVELAETDKLIERLRRGPDYDYDGYKAYKLMQEAADALEAQQARIEELQDLLEEGIRRVDPINANVISPSASEAWIAIARSVCKEGE